MKRSTKTKRRMKTLSIILIFMLLMTNVFSIAANASISYEANIQAQDRFTTFISSDPLEFMQDIPVEPFRVSDDLWEHRYDAERLTEFPEEIRREFELREHEIDDGSTDRYIVRYRSGGKQSFQSKLSSEIAYSEAISVSVDRAVSIDNRIDSQNMGRDRELQTDSGSLSRNRESSILLTSEWEVLTLNEAMLPSEFAEVIRSSQALGDIEFIQPDYKLSLAGIDDDVILEDNEDQIPDDDDIEELSNDRQPDEDEYISESIDDEEDILIQINETMQDTSSNVEIIVAVIDTGIDIYHDDLIGYIDTDNMWDFTQNTSEIYSPANPLESAHGTHIAGIIANTARENGANNIKILPLRVFNNGVAYTSDVIAAIEYAIEKGATIINCSFGSTQENPILEEIMASANALFVCAVGNNRRDLTERPSYPASYDLPNIISVASVNADGGFSYFSNYGENIDITALGRDVWSTFPENQHGTLTGTSMSAAYVTAVAAVVSANEHSSAEELRYRLLDTADRLSNLQNKVDQGRRVNLANAVNNIVSASTIQNNPEDDFDVHGYQMTESELFELYSSKSVVQVAAGGSHTLVLMSDGTVWAWGSNDSGQCGNGTMSFSESLAQVIGLSGVTAISAGDSHSMALRNDGTVWAWGLVSGQLNDIRLTPVQVAGLNGVTAISAGGTHSMALRNDGTVWAWGSNGNGQLGDGTTTNRTMPVQVAVLSGATAISAGASHSMALRDNGIVWSWGNNANGRLGDGTTTQRSMPVQVAGLSGVTAVSAGGTHSMALHNDGTVWAWGSNGNGQLGDGTATQRTMPVQVTGLSGVTAVSAGGTHSMALRNDGTVWAWGNNHSGRLGDGTTTNRTMPVQVAGLSGVTAISAGEWHSMALRNDGTVWAWGWNEYEQLGDGAVTQRSTPVQVIGLSGVTAISAGITHNMALRNDGTVWAWGSNGNGRLGDGTTTNRTMPVQVAGLSGVTAISAGGWHSMALRNDGTVWAWGNNGSGRLGDGTTTNRTTPVQVIELSGVTAISAGIEYSMALRNDGTVWAWGNNGSGQLGDGTITARITPVQVTGLSGVTAISAGDSHSLALRNNGTIWAWGSNGNGQLGDGTTTARTTPVQVTGLNGVTAISAGYLHSLALKNDGTIWAWGDNRNGQLGDGTTTQRTTPVQVTRLSGVTAISTGDRHSMALRNDGTVWAWGYNWHGRLGNGTTIGRAEQPIQVINLNEVTAISSGSVHSMALRNDSIVWAWGANYNGQLGLPVTQNSNVPIMSQTNILPQENMPNAGIDYVNGVLTGLAAGIYSFNGGTNVTVTGTTYAIDAEWYGTTVSIVKKSENIDTIDSKAQNLQIPARPAIPTGLTGIEPITMNGANGAINGTTAEMEYSVAGADSWNNCSVGSTLGLIAGNYDVRIKAVAGVSFKSEAILITIPPNDGKTIKSFTLAGIKGTITEGSPNTIEVIMPVKTNITSLTPVIIHTGVSISPTGEQDFTNPVTYTVTAEDGTTKSYIVTVHNPEIVAQIVAGREHTIALKPDGTVWAWGRNNNGQLGDGTTTQRTTPVQVTGLTEIVAISAGDYHNIALKSDGTVWAWGLNTNGRLGDNTTTQRNTPVQVRGANNTGMLTDITAIAAGGSHSMALKSDGTVWAWGLNTNGRLGDNTTTQRNTPVQVRGANNTSILSDITAIAAGEAHSLALKSDGTVWAWGNNQSGRLGDNTTTQRNTPVQVRGANNSGMLTDITAISAGGSHSLALKSDGTVWAWGNNQNGRLGDNTTTQRNTPVQVRGANNTSILTDITAIVAGDAHNLALKSDGTVWTWGNNGSGRLGDGTTTQRATPVQVRGANNTGVLADMTAITAGESHSIALKSDGSVWAWGNNANGRLGDNTTTNRTTPVQNSMFMPLLVIRVNLNKVSTTIIIGDTETLTAAITPSNATNQAVIWESSDESVAAVDENGVVTAISAGTATITVTTECGDMTATCVVTVQQAAVSLNKNITANTDFIVVCSLDNITSFDGSTFKITYNPGEVTLVDFAAQTTELNVSVGVVPGTDLEILSHDTSTGVLTFKVNKTIPSEQMWSGAVTILKFRANVTGDIMIEFEKIELE